MITIGTNLINKISSVHKEALEKAVKELFKIGGDFKLEEYKEKGTDTDGKNKLFLGGVPLQNILANIEEWLLFSGLISTIFNYYSVDVGNTNELQFWVTSIPEPIPVNIFFSLRNADEVGQKMQSLRDTLTISDVFNQDKIKEGKILIVGYDNEGNAWRINYL